MILTDKQLYKNKKFMWGRIAASILILLVLFVLSLSSFPLMTTYSYRDMDDTQEYFYMVQGNRIEQVIQFKQPYVERLSVCINNMTYETHGILKIYFHEQGSENTLAESQINLENAKIREFIWFDVKQEVDTEKLYELVIATENVDGEVRVLGRNQDNTIAEVMESATEYGVPLDGHLAVDIAYRAKLGVNTRLCLWLIGIIFIAYILGWEYIIETKNRLQKSIMTTIMLLILPIFYNYCVPNHDAVHTKMYLGLAVYFAIIVFIIFGLFCRKKITFISFFIAVTLLNGIVYSFVFMPVSSPDEETHFYESYRLSSIMMGQESTDEYGNVLVRKCDLQEKETQITDNYVIQLWNKCQEKISTDDEQMVASDFPWVVYAPILGYIPQAIGISFARLLHVNYFWLMYFGRFANLIAFTILVTIGMSVIPKAKWIVFAICNFPFLIQEVASYSYDTLIIAFSILLGCYVFKLMEQEKQISRGQLVTLLVICICFANFKPVYYPMIGLVFLIPNKKINKCYIKAIGIKGAIVAIAFGVLLLVFHHGSPLNMESLRPKCIEMPVNEMIEVEPDLYAGWVKPEEGIVHFSSGVTETAISYLLHNPLDFFQRVVYTFFESIDWFVLYIFGNYMGGHEIRIPIVVTILFMFYFFNCVAKEKNTEYSIPNVKMKFYILLLNCVSIFGLFLVSYLQWSPLGERRLIGIQGRYFYPLLITFIFGNYGKKQKIDEDYFTELSVISIVHILTLLYSQSIIWNR